MGPVTITQQETEMELAVMKCMISPLVRVFDPPYFSCPNNGMLFLDTSQQHQIEEVSIKLFLG